MGKDQSIILKVNKDEALVLSDFLSRFNEKNIEGVFQDQSEQKVLWILESQLEQILTEPFLPNYLEILSEARDRVKDK
jgi:hypothetical protein